MARITWNASGGTGVFSPNDNPLTTGQSDATDARFGGHRKITSTSKTQDYTSRTGASVDIKENPIEDVVKDIDDLSDSKQRKNEFSRQEELSDVQKGNTADFMVAIDRENSPPEDTDAFEPDVDLVKKRRSKLKGHFGDGQYDNMPNRGSSHESENN